MVDTLKKLTNQLISDLYKIDILRFIIVYLRFIIFYIILRRKKLLYDEKSEIENIITFKEKKINDFSKERINSKETTIEHNLIYTKNLFSIKKKYKQFIGGKTKSLIAPIESLDFVDKENFKILSIGPRNEGEIYLIKSFGYKWKNIFAIDLQTYTGKIKLCDMHDICFDNDFFDIVLSGWTLAYSSNKNKALDEIKRVAKNNAIISIGYTYLPEEKKYEVLNTDKRLISNDQIIDHFKVIEDNIYYNFDSFKINKSETRHSLITFRINK